MELVDVTSTEQIAGLPSGEVRWLQREADLSPAPNHKV